jgi:hypothetical protein
MLRDIGWLTINRVAAHRSGTTKSPRRRIPKSSHVETKNIRRPDGTTTTISLYACDGAIGIGELDDQGELHFQPLRRKRTHRTQDKNGKYRWYNDYELPAGGDVTVRLHATTDDTRRQFNRTENLRPIPASDPDFGRLYRRRNDAESINRALDDTLWIGRAHSVGHERQTLNLLGFALMTNSLARARHRQHLPAAAKPTGHPGLYHARFVSNSVPQARDAAKRAPLVRTDHRGRHLQVVFSHLFSNPRARVGPGENSAGAGAVRLRERISRIRERGHSGSGRQRPPMAADHAVPSPILRRRAGSRRAHAGTCLIRAVSRFPGTGRS